MAQKIAEPYFEDGKWVIDVGGSKIRISEYEEAINLYIDISGVERQKFKQPKRKTFTKNRGRITVKTL